MEFRRVLFRSERHARGGQIVRSRDLGHRDAGRAGLSNRVQSAPSTHLEGAMSVTIRPGAMRLADWRTIWRGAAVVPDRAADDAIAAGAAAAPPLPGRPDPVSGVNTGFGKPERKSGG